MDGFQALVSSRPKAKAAPGQHDVRSAAPGIAEAQLLLPKNHDLHGVNQFLKCEVRCGNVLVDALVLSCGRRLVFARTKKP